MSGEPAFDWAAPTRILFRAGALAEVGRLARQLGSRALVVTGRTLARSARLIDLLRAEHIHVTTFAIGAEPDLEMVRAGTGAALAAECDVVLAMGGGSVLDAGKAIAALRVNGGDPLDYLEIIGRGKPLSLPPVPFIAIPTTAGTGSEVTRNAVLSSPEHRIKVSLRSPLMVPRVAVVDPELTRELPPELTASTGFDALTQLIEPFVCTRANPMTDALCREGIARAARSLPRAWKNGADGAARTDMALASLFGGLALANAGLGAVHGFAGPMGGMFPAAHGALCAALLPHVMQGNIAALQRRAPGHPALARYVEVARLLTGQPNATAEDGVNWVHRLATSIRIQPLSSLGIAIADVPELVEGASRASSMKANPVELGREELADILRSALG
jgi:alcohol dehydrogenase class IV